MKATLLRRLFKQRDKKTFRLMSRLVIRIGAFELRRYTSFEYGYRKWIYEYWWRDKWRLSSAPRHIEWASGKIDIWRLHFGFGSTWGIYGVIRIWEGPFKGREVVFGMPHIRLRAM